MGRRQRRSDPKDFLSKFRVNLRQHRRDDVAHQAQRIGARRGRGRHLRRAIEGKTSILDDLLDAVAGMNARETKAPLRSIELKQAAIGDERDRPSRSNHIVGAAAPGALMKSTLGTSVRRECSVRNRMTRGTT